MEENKLAKLIGSGGITVEEANELDWLIHCFHLEFVCDIRGTDDEGNAFHEAIYWYPDDYCFSIYRESDLQNERFGSRCVGLNDIDDLDKVSTVIHAARTGYTDEDIDKLRDVAGI